MAYEIKILRNDCISAGTCIIDAPNTFGFDDEDKAIVFDPQGDHDEDILCAAQGCPTDAIVIIDRQTGQQIWPEE